MNKYTFTIDNFNIIYPVYLKSKSGRYYKFKHAVLNSNYSRTTQLNNRSIQSVQFDLLVDIDYFNIPIHKEFVLINTNLSIDSIRSYYLLDYFIPSKSLCIELDSDLHNDNKDKLKDRFLESLGIKVLMIRDFNIETKDKLEVIINFVQSNPINEFKIDYSELIEEYEEYKKGLICKSIDIPYEEYKDLYFIRNKWRKAISKLSRYDSNILSALQLNVNYSFDISLSEIHDLIPMSEKKVKKYYPLINYLRTLGIDMKILTSWNS